MSASSHYEVLGVEPNASSAEIRSAYLTAARANHPDLAAGQAAEQRMRRINEAWAVLGDPEARRQYDRCINATRPGMQSAGFVPFDSDEDPEDPARQHDVAYSSRPLAPVVQLAPAGLLVTGLVTAGAGGFFQSAELLALGAVVIMAGLGAFVAMPLLVALRSHRDTPE